MRHLICLLLLAASGAHAQYKCQTADGISYQDTACPGGVPIAELDASVSYYEHRWAWVAPRQEPVVRHRHNDRRWRGNKVFVSCVQPRQNERRPFPPTGRKPAPVLVCGLGL